MENQRHELDTKKNTKHGQIPQGVREGFPKMCGFSKLSSADEVQKGLATARYSDAHSRNSVH